ncbi:MAG TPA: HAMP domain-containing protein [Acidobacteria bacterium]|nr:HAMP domain-containing protein [Acidobacteriota bacterium]
MRRSIAGKLSLIISLSLVVVFGATALLNLTIQERAGMRILRLNGAQLADLVAGATRTAMLHNDREQIQKTIDTLASQRDIERIRIIQKGGRIAYSTDPTEIGTVIDMHEEQCVACHQKSQPPEDLPMEARARIVHRDDHRVLGITQTIRNEPDCSNASCHVHATSDHLLGVLDVNLALGPYDRARSESAAELLVASLLGIILVVGITVWASQRMVHKPVRMLIRETKKIAAGDLSARVPEASDDEIGALARTFNRMARDLEVARSELLEWGRTLEDRVRQKTEELQRAQHQILQVEKMASLGKLAAVVAHEINNPLASVVTYAKILVRRLRSHELTEECRQNLEYLESIASEATRCGEIVSQLLSFARRRGGEFGPTDINHVVEKSLFLVHHKLELSNVEAKTDLAQDLPEIIADSSQIQQALMALLINACQAMEDTGGEVHLTTRPAPEGGAVIEVADTGPGMPPEVAQHAFEPFFTTKEQGSGVGLGLSVVYGIVERHGGTIRLDTAVGEGCRFTISLPERPPHGVQDQEVES